MNNITDEILKERLDGLSPQKRALFEQLLKKNQAQQKPDVHRPLPPFALVSVVDKNSLPGSVEDAYPISSVQLGMLYHMELTQDSVSPADYHNLGTFRLKLSRPYNHGLFEQAVNQVIANQPNLRTTFDLTSYSEPLQLIHKTLVFKVDYEDLRALEAIVQEGRIDQYIARENRNTIDVKVLPLIRFYVHQLADDVISLSFTEPHSIADGWSVHLTFVDIFNCYFSLLDGRELPLVRLATAYSNFVEQERNTVKSPETIAFWQKKLAECAPVEFPYGAVTSPDPLQLDSHRGSFDLPADVVSRLHAIVERSGFPLKAIFLAAHAKLLSLVTGKNKATTGLMFNGRLEVDTGDMVRGLFLNTLPVTLDTGGGTWLDLIRQAHNAELEVIPHRRYPIGELQRLYGEQPVINTMLGFLHFHSIADGLHDKKVEVLNATDLSKTNYDFTALFSLDPTDKNKIRFIGDANLRKISREQYQKMLGYYQNIIRAIAENPNARYQNHEVLLEDEKRKLLVDWVNTEKAYATHSCIHELFERQAGRTPEKVALYCAGRSLTYAKLNEKSNRLAALLVARGVKPDSLVALCVDRSMDMVIAMLAVLKAGGAYVTMDPAYPEERLSFYLGSSQAKIVITGESIRPRLALVDQQVICLDNGELQETLKQYSPENINPASLGLSSENLAYVIYTSGSTGQPKGVMIEHRNTVAFLDWALETFTAEQTASVLASTSICFDLSIFEIFLPLCRGGKVIIVDSILALRDELPGQDPSLINTVPSAIKALMETHSLPASVKTVNLAGEALAQSLVDDLYGLGVDHVYDLYGPSEDTTYSTYTRREAGGTATIGKPISNTRAYVLDNNMGLLPIGVAGELYLGGSGLARGYLNQPHQTAEKFLLDPFGSGVHARLYKTGDLVRWNAEGQLVYLGRIDHQVKIRGYRIELGEIESCLNKLSGIKESVVVAKGEGNAKHLAAYLVSTTSEDNPSLENSRAWVAAIRAKLATILPAYMVPATFMVLDKLPLTLNGKIDRKALPDIDIEGQVQSTYVAPRNSIEQSLCDLWKILLGVQKVGIDDNFFLLGGHSILAVRLSAHIKEKLHKPVSIQTIFQAATVRNLAAALGSSTEGVLENTINPKPSDVRDIPLSFAQQRLWILNEVKGGSVEYNMPAAFTIKGAFDVGAAQQAISRIINRHEILRTVYLAPEGIPVQEIKDEFDFIIARHDLTALETDQKNNELARLLREDTLAPFDLAKDLMVRASFLQLTENANESEGVLVFTLHHIAADGWSLGLLVNEFVRQYQAAMGGGDDAFAPMPIQYSDYAYWQQQAIQHNALKQSLAYWEQQLRHLPKVHHLPLDYHRPRVQRFSGAGFKNFIDRDTRNALAHYCQQSQCTLFMGLHAVFAALLGRYSNETDIVVGTPVVNREQTSTDELIGCFINNLVIRTDLSGKPDFATLVAQSRETLLAAFAHQQAPFEQLVEKIDPERSGSYSPLFQVMLILQNNDQGNLDIPGLQLQPLEQPVEVTKYDLTLSISDRENGLELAWEYNTDLFHVSTIEQLAGHFSRLLELVIASPRQSIVDFNLLDDIQLENIHRWNDTRAEFPRDGLIHQFFSQRAAQNPDAVAVMFDGEKIRYSELELRANNLAHYLIAAGVKPDSLVGICLERSITMVIGLLAILKAGGAYVPLDPGYPINRLKMMLEDSACGILLTQMDVAAFLEDALPARTLCLDAPDMIGQLQQQPGTAPDVDGMTSSHLAYVIYTSGSTGRPKGVMVEHKNVLNFFTALDKKFPQKHQKNWLALTSISFDISVLELFWTLINGDTIFLAPERVVAPGANCAMDFSLFYFAAEEAKAGAAKYSLLLEGAKYADNHGFAGIWIPERHFHSFGDQFPNPSVAAAAIAATTKNIRIRSGSVVLPLHDPIRVAEEWSMVDNLSDGRVELSLASGWHPNDFVFFPQHFHDRHRVMRENLVILKDLWQGKACKRINGSGQEIDVVIHPKPVQETLPCWITAAGSDATFTYAGTIGANVLTHLLGQSPDELRRKIALYRQALADNGFDPAQGRVALMIHTFIGDNAEDVKQKVEGPFKNYLRHSVGLIKPIAEELGMDTEKDLDALVDMGFARYFNDSGLFGTPDSVLAKIEQLNSIGVDECACLIDFGVDHDDVIASFPHLRQLKSRVRQQHRQFVFLQEKLRRSTMLPPLSHTLVNERITHIQCTPSYAHELINDLAEANGEHRVNTLLVGGEALPLSLSKQLMQDGCINVFNMYGPTETTVWSSIANVTGNDVYLAGPIANTEFYVVANGQLAPVGVAGELYIGGEGVTRGYWQRPELTQERFCPNIFSTQRMSANSQPRLYKTGDLVRWLADGRLEFLGRIDHQVKIRGFRIELSEIDQQLATHRYIRESVVIARGGGTGATQLVAYLVPAETIDKEKLIADIRSELAQVLPDYMVPAIFIILDALPLTPNGKIDRKALPEPGLAVARNLYEAPGTPMEALLCDIWQDLLRIETVGTGDNFFQLGGHSLQVMQMISQLKKRDIAMTARQLFDNAVLANLATVLDDYKASGQADYATPPNVIKPDVTQITPEMVPLAEVTQKDIDTLVARVPGGIGNLQDIYPLSPCRRACCSITR
ncbi:hypothetical protein CBP51_05055 [Cellvibrio mixtus]|uniref:Carrier domain-containing protein n=1 Tax=Cellvibrio mixtus TaxID=39650 RepID=A0A266Q956_9GAMM|nr:non-ribosomal peptide synthetase [Cellvibrio mixtus]OZY86398.1 hypothetical protein CBP51_05055 [Cellvibrio mixtus]